jgi:hypothetical protein
MEPLVLTDLHPLLITHSDPLLVTDSDSLLCTGVADPDHLLRIRIRKKIQIWIQEKVTDPDPPKLYGSGGIRFQILNTASYGIGP